MSRRLSILALLLLTLPGCRRPPEVNGPYSPDQANVTVLVVNNYALPVEIYVVGSSINQRLGLVHPGMSGQFGVPPTLIGNGDVEFQARPGNSQQYARSGPMLLHTGAVVRFFVSPQLFNSTATIE